MSQEEREYIPTEETISGKTFNEAWFHTDEMDNKLFKNCKFYKCEFSAFTIVNILTFEGCLFYECTFNCVNGDLPYYDDPGEIINFIGCKFLKLNHFECVTVGNLYFRGCQCGHSISLNTLAGKTSEDKILVSISKIDSFHFEYCENIDFHVVESVIHKQLFEHTTIDSLDVVDSKLTHISFKYCEHHKEMEFTNVSFFMHHDYCVESICSKIGRVDFEGVKVFIANGYKDWSMLWKSEFSNTNHLHLSLEFECAYKYRLGEYDEEDETEELNYIKQYLDTDNFKETKFNKLYMSDSSKLGVLSADFNLEDYKYGIIIQGGKNIKQIADDVEREEELKERKTRLMELIEKNAIGVMD